MLNRPRPCAARKTIKPGPSVTNLFSWGWSRSPPATSVPFLVAGGLKAAHDLLLWVVFRKVPLRA
ncbi:MAG: hypothetical protein C4316_10510 [Chloroflexota bacterium]